MFLYCINIQDKDSYIIFILFHSKSAGPCPEGTWGSLRQHVLDACNVADLFVSVQKRQSVFKAGRRLPLSGPHVAWGIKKPGERFCSPGTRSVMVKRPTRRYQTAWKKGSSSARKGFPFSSRRIR